MTSFDEDEELLDTGADRRRGNRKLRIELGVGAVVLAGAVLVGRSLSDGSGPAKPPPSPSASAAATSHPYGTGAPDSGSGLLNGMATISATDGVVIVEPRLPEATGADPTQCPQSIACFSVDRVTASAEAALRTAFPHAVVESAVTVRLNQEPYGQMLWFLQLNARVGSTQILVRVQAPGVGDQVDSGVDRNGARGSIAHASATLQQYFVQVQADNPTTREQSVRPVAELAHDVRLLAAD